MKNIKTTLNKAVAIISKYLEIHSHPDTKVVNYQAGNILKEKFDLTLAEDGVALEELIPIVESYLQYSVRTGSTQFFNLLFSGYSIPGILGEMVTSATNTTMHTYEVAPVATLMEIELIKKLNGLVGFNEGEGLMVTGGSNANRMIPEELELAIQQSLSKEETPFFVGATAGTTVLGAFDSLPPLAEITRKYGLWLHVDGAWGGPVLFSAKHQHLLGGSELVDSFTWDAHKLMGVPLICSAILVKEKGTLSEACSGGGTDYLFHDDDNDLYNLGKMSLQCGRKVDALKFWLCWQYSGKKGYEKQVDSLFDLANYVTEYIRSCKDLELIAEPKFLNICFRYNPQNKHLSDIALDQLNLEIRQALINSGETFVNYAHYQGKIIIRLILANSELQKANLETFFHNVLNAGKIAKATKLEEEQ